MPLASIPLPHTCSLIFNKPSGLFCQLLGLHETLITCLSSLRPRDSPVQSFFANVHCLPRPLFSQIIFFADPLLRHYPDVWLFLHFSCPAPLGTEDRLHLPVSCFSWSRRHSAGGLSLLFHSCSLCTVQRDGTS